MYSKVGHHASNLPDGVHHAHYIIEPVRQVMLPTTFNERFITDQSCEAGPFFNDLLYFFFLTVSLTFQLQYLWQLSLNFLDRVEWTASIDRLARHLNYVTAPKPTWTTIENEIQIWDVKFFALNVLVAIYAVYAVHIPHCQLHLK